MSIEKRLQRQRKRRKFRVRGKFASRGSKIRISVFRSSKHIYAQAIDDSKGSTVASFSTLKLGDFKGDKSSAAKEVGLNLSKALKSVTEDSLFFDRGSYKYHGRIKALADGLREGGLKF